MAEAAAPVAASTPWLVRAIGLHGAAVAAPISILLFNRARLASEFEVLGALTAEATIAAAVLVLGCVATVRTRDVLPAGVFLWLSALVATLGLALAAWTIEIVLFTVAAIIVAAALGPAMALHRVMVSTASTHQTRFRYVSRYWVGVACGAGWPLGLRVIAEPSVDTQLWIAMAVMAGATAALTPHALAHDDDVVSEGTSPLLDTPWVRRSKFAALTVGAAMVAAASPAQELLLDEWQRSDRQLAAVLGVSTLAAALVAGFGSWYHRLGELTGSRRADVIGLQLFGAGAAITTGALSFTYIGLVVSWTVGGGLLCLAAIGLDASTFASSTPAVRRRIASGQVQAAAVGAAVACSVNAWLIDGLHAQWRIAWLGPPIAYVGWHVRRYSDSARPPELSAVTTSAATVPRRVDALDGEAGTAPTDLLRVENLAVAYGDVQVLFGVDLKVQPGQVVALLGTNGAGKTTLLRTISGLEPSLSGRIVYAGLNITRTRPTWRVGMGLHQIVGGEAVVGPMTIEENLRLFSHGIDPVRRSDAIEEAVALFPRLAERRSQRAATLSGGEKQMLALAKAIIVRPQLLLIDEFSLGLAPTVIADLLPVVRTIAERGAAVLLVEQSVNIALSVADHAYVMEKGSIGWEGSAADLRARPELLQSAYLKGLAQALDT